MIHRLRVESLGPLPATGRERFFEDRQQLTLEQWRQGRGPDEGAEVESEHEI